MGQTLNRKANNEDDPDETPQYAASDQEIHWLVTKYSIKIHLTEKKSLEITSFN